MKTTWLKKKKTNRLIIVHKTQKRKLKNKEEEPNQKLGVLLSIKKKLYMKNNIKGILYKPMIQQYKRLTFHNIS